MKDSAKEETDSKCRITATAKDLFHQQGVRAAHVDEIVRASGARFEAGRYKPRQVNGGRTKRGTLSSVLTILAGAMLCGGGEAQDTTPAQIARMEGAQSPNRQGLDPYTIPELMKRFHVPGVSIAVARDFKVLWTKTYGVADVVTNAPVTRETRFQAASTSKAVTAFAVLRAVDAGKVSLDENINNYLKAWKVPENEYTRGGITLRALLSHTSGTGDGFGFPGYKPSAPLPTLEQILDGKPPSNVGPVFWERPPFTAQKYSGGGIVIEQLVLQDVYGKKFAEIMQELVLGPVGMTNSTFEQPLPATEDENAARAHDQYGKAMDVKWHVYPEQAAAGLWTTPTDLAKLGIEVQKALRGESKLLSRSTALEMVAPIGTGSFAIGFGIEKKGEGWYFTHDGANWGFRGDLLMHRLKGYGIAVMTNGDSGGQLINEIEARVAAVANWDSLDKPVLR
jgi:CubicO group peptidase (beta-lactamase class C family)